MDLSQTSENDISDPSCEKCLKEVKSIETGSSDRSNHKWTNLILSGPIQVVSGVVIAQEVKLQTNLGDHRTDSRCVRDLDYISSEMLDWSKVANLEKLYAPENQRVWTLWLFELICATVSSLST